MRSLFCIFLFALINTSVEAQSVEEVKTKVHRIVVENNYMINVSFFNRLIEKKANWKEPPNIIVCKGTVVSKTRIKKAISFWEHLGYSFGEIFYFSCPFDTQYHGAIYIMEPKTGFDFSQLANTHTAYAEFNDKSREIIGSWIEIPNSEIEKDNVLEHELGHARGFQHTSQSNHIMNKEFSNLGTITTGLNFNLH